MVLQSAGPGGRAGHAGMGYVPLPKKLLETGVRDLLRISDARMSGTSYGACILHVAPESAGVGGPLALLRTGDIVRLDLPNRRLDMLVGEAELDAPPRRMAAAGAALRAAATAGCSRSHVSQADKGCDFDYLQRRTSARPAGEPDIF